MIGNQVTITSETSDRTTASHEMGIGSRWLPDTVLSTLRCSVCGSRCIERDGDGLQCPRCRTHIKTCHGIVELLPEAMSVNNARELNARDGSSVWHVVSSPFKRPSSVRRVYLEQSQLIRRFAIDIYESSSILYLFAGDGVEAHLSGIMNERTVLSDISESALRCARQRVESYRLARPAAYVQCDAERLPFGDQSYDIVIAFKGIHHCLIPQSALAEVWRVAGKRAIVFDNWQCLLTNVLYSLSLSSRIEYSGLKPHRFNKLALQTMMYNAGIDNYHIETCMPHLVDRYVGWRGRRLIQRFMKPLSQGNQFLLVVDKIGTNLKERARVRLAEYESNPTGFVPSEEQPALPT